MSVKIKFWPKKFGPKKKKLVMLVKKIGKKIQLTKKIDVIRVKRNPSNKVLVKKFLKKFWSTKNFG